MAKQQETQWQRWQRIAKAADVNWRTVRAYEAGEPMRESTLRRINHAKLAKKGERR